MRHFTLATLTALGLMAALPLAQAQTPQPAAPAAKTAPAPAAPAARPMPAETKAAPAAKTEPLDINTATLAQLEALKGVGKARAEAIIKNRPYKGKDDLVQKKIVPENVYADIKDHIVARQH